MTRKILLSCAVAAWLCALAGGWAWMGRYRATRGEQALAPPLLPAALKQVALDAGQERPTLFVAMHPQCSCSRATLHELRRVLDQAGAVKPAVYVLLYRPSQRPAAWDDTGILATESLGSNAKVVTDTDGMYAAALRASTSGEVVLYARDGRLLFQGGVTASRGHEGPSAGADRLQAALQHNIPSSTAASVFGCNIFHRVPPAAGKL